jgi:membrane protein required for beta-lactamase induction
MDIESPFTMVVLIVLIAVGAGVVKTWLETKANASTNSEDRDRMAKMEAEIDRLNERVRTLERLATDPEQRLREDFSRLA